MSNRIKMLVLSIGVATLLGGLIGCGGKKEEEPPIDPAKEGKFTAPAVKTTGGPGGAGTGTAAKPDTQ